MLVSVESRYEHSVESAFNCFFLPCRSEVLGDYIRLSLQ